MLLAEQFTRERAREYNVHYSSIVAFICGSRSLLSVVMDGDSLVPKIK